MPQVVYANGPHVGALQSRLEVLEEPHPAAAPLDETLVRADAESRLLQPRVRVS
jgi:hypothetical protein